MLSNNISGAKNSVALNTAEARLSYTPLPQMIVLLS